MIDFDPIAEIQQAEAIEKNAAAAEVEYQQLCRELFSTGTGRRWLSLAMARRNFMGSVFEAHDGMSATSAAYRDGARSVFSDILNSSAMAPRRKPNDPDETEHE